jgi:hypothetical protein
MNIIKSTNLIQCTCIGCYSVLEVGPEDIKVSEVGHPYGEWFVCPVCGKLNPMDGKIPKKWIPIVYKDEPV